MLRLLPTLFSIVCITVLGGFAMDYGMNGAIFGTCIAAIAGLGGYTVKQLNK